MTTFEQFLIDKHATQYLGTDDDMPDDFDEWLCQLTNDEWIKLGELFGKECSFKAIDNIEQAIQRITAPLGDK